MYHLIRPLLFRLPAERAHDLTIGGLALLAQFPALCARLRSFNAALGPGLARTVAGIDFPTPLGVAGGLDKNGRAIHAWHALGFGFAELGTVTKLAQPGNEPPRMFRLVQHEAVINRMGFNNAGVDALADRLARLGPAPLPLGISLGKSKLTPLEDAEYDYVYSLQKVLPYSSYIAVNISSPNTAGLRGLQDRAALDRLLSALQRANRAMAGGGKPLFVKLAPDLSEAAIREALQVCADHSVAGIIAVNTTLSRAGLAGADPRLVGQAGGLSGLPLRARALEVVRLVARETAGRLPIIGVGGISSPDDALRMLEAGASLLQIYTGLVYQGPGLIGQINRAVAR